MTSLAEQQQSSWRRWLFVAGAIALLCFGVYRCVVATTYGATDFRVYEAAVAVWRAGGNPYDAAALAEHGSQFGLNHVYPPLITHALAPLVDLGFGGAVWCYALALVSGCLALALTLSPRRFPWLLGLAAFGATGFAAARWNFQTGNLGLIEFLLFAVAMVALTRQRLLLFAVLIGLLGFTKLLPLCFSLLLLPMLRGGKAKAHVLLWPAAVFLLLHGVSYALDPQGSVEYLKMLIGSTQGQYTPLHETTSGNNTPTFVLMLIDLVRLRDGIGTGDLVALVMLAAAGWVAWRASVLIRTAGIQAAAAVATIALLLAWPRLKPYSYGYACVAVMVGAAVVGPRRAIALLVVCGAVAAVMPWMPNLPIEALQLVKRNHQAVLLLAAGVLLAWPAQPPHGEPS